MNPFILKLRIGARLTPEDNAVLERLAAPTRQIRRGDITSEGVEPHFIVLVLDGWACRYKQLENGKRQITSLFLPGDLCEPFGALPYIMNHTLGALTPVLLARVPLHAIRNAARASPRIEEALWWDLLFSETLHREHLVSLGRRSATERLGNLFCNVHFRLELVGLATPSSCQVPLSQADLADFLGLSAVHVNRSLQELRSTGLLSLRDRQLTIHDVHGLRELSMFNPDDFLPSDRIPIRRQPLPSADPDGPAMTD